MIDIIKPSTILIIFSNVLIFMFMQILLFWYIISKAVENIIIDKSSIIGNIVKNSTRLQVKLNEYIQTDDYQIIYNQSLIDKQQRTEYNMKLTWQWMLIPFLLVIIILIIGILYTIYVHRYTSYNTLKLDQTDLILLVTVVLSFLTETIFIFVLVIRYVYISDMDIIIFFINSDIGKGIITEYIPTYSPFTFSPF